MGSTKRINVGDFEELYLSKTFRNLTPVIFLHEGRFWHVMGLELLLPKRRSGLSTSRGRSATS